MAKTGLKRAIPLLVFILLSGCIPPNPQVVEDIDNLKREVESQRQTFRTTSVDLAKEREGVRTSLTGIQRDIDGMKKEAELRREDIKTLNENFMRERARTAASLEELQRDVMGIKRQAEDLSKEKARTAASLEELQRDVMGIKRQVEDLAKERGQIQQDIASIKKDVELQGRTISNVTEDLRRERAATAASLDEIKVKMAHVEGRFEEGRFEAQRAREALENLQSKTPDKKEVATRFTEVQTTLEGLEKRITLETGRTKAIEERAASIERQIATDSERIKGLEERLTLLEKEGEVKRIAKEETPPPNPEALYNESLQLIKDKKDYDPGIKALRRFINLFPDHDLADNAQYWIGEGYYAQRDYERAILEFNEVMKRYPGGDKVPSATLKQAMAFYELGKRGEAKVLLERVKERYPATEEATIARKKLEEMK